MNTSMTKCLLAVEGHKTHTAWIKTELAIEGKKLMAKGRKIMVFEVYETKEFSDRDLDKQEGKVEQYWKIDLQEI